MPYCLSNFDVAVPFAFAHKNSDEPQGRSSQNQNQLCMVVAGTLPSNTCILSRFWGALGAGVARVLEIYIGRVNSLDVVREERSKLYAHTERLRVVARQYSD